jgi:hypothetical protein
MLCSEKKENDSDAHARHFLRTTSQLTAACSLALHAAMQGASVCFWGKTHRRCSDPSKPTPREHVPPAGPCVCLALACIGGASANWGGARGEEIGGSRLRAGPGGGTAHAPVN